MRRELVTSIHAGDTALQTAERLLDVGEPLVRLPQHVRDLRAAARQAIETGDRALYENAVEKWSKRIQRLGQGRGRTAGPYTVRSATQQLVTDLRGARLDQVDGAVDRWVLERARHQARTVARTETVEAYRDVYKAETSDKEYVVGFRWLLSTAHPRPDECDVLASQDLYGLGPGGYPVGSTPLTPHPHDLCSQVAIIDTGHFRRKIAALKGEAQPGKPWESGTRETGEQWLRRQPEKYQRALLGPSRLEAFKQGRTVLRPDGTVLPAHEVLGLPKPVRGLGPAVRAAPIIQRDRQTMTGALPLPKPGKG